MRYKLLSNKASKAKSEPSQLEWHPKLGKPSPSAVHSLPNTAAGQRGQKPTSSNIEKNIGYTLQEAWSVGFTTKSDFARANADYVAIAACMGWISTRIFPPDVWGSTWQITSKGLRALEELYGINTEEEADPEEDPEIYYR